MRRVSFLTLAVVAACGGAEHKPVNGPPSPPAAKPAPSPDEPSAEPDETTGTDGCPGGMVRVTGGSLRMGSPAGSGAADEHPQTEIAVAEFCLDADEVTVQEYEACTKNRACAPLARDAELLTPVPEGEQADLSKYCSARMADNQGVPATCVSHSEAVRYCAWKGFRLPTEAEWEWAATGGSDKQSFPWGANPPNDETVCWQRSRGPCRIKSKPAQAFGTFDLAGNVAEWTSTAYGPYGGKPPDETKKAVRGGSWESDQADEVRPKRRASRPAGVRDPTIGFRCAKEG